MPQAFDLVHLSLDQFYRPSNAFLEYAFEIGAIEMLKLRSTLDRRLEVYREMLTAPSLTMSS
jgi:hypothetical protein